MNLWKNENLNPKKHPQHLCRGKSQKFTTPRWNTSMKPNWKEWRRIYVSWWIIIWRIKRGKKYISVSDSWRIWSVLRIRSFFYIRIVAVLNSGILYLTTKNPSFPTYRNTLFCLPSENEREAFFIPVNMELRVKVLFKYLIRKKIL